MYRSQQLALKYFTAAIALFGVMTLSGLMSAYYYINPDFLFGLLHFNIAKILHIDTMVIWLLMGFMGAIYWFLPEEFGRELAGIRAAEILFYVFCAAVAVVAVVFILVQYGSSDETALWLINQGRKYVEAPRWAAIGVVVVMLVFAYNVIGTAYATRRITGITAVLMIDLVPLVLLYLIAFPAISNMSADLFWWWWLVHLWVEATWEVLIGCIMAWTLMQLLGTSRRIVETWLYIEVALVLGTGILGLGHHYFWIGTPNYWLAIGGFFSALEPLPLLGMVIHAIYDAGTHHMKTTNRPVLLLDDGGGVRQFPRRRRLGLHDHAAAGQSLCPRDAVDRIARTFRVLGRLRLRCAVGHLSGSPEDPRSRPCGWHALEVVVRGAQSWSHRHGGRLVGVGLCASLCRTCDRRIDSRCIHCRPGEPMVRRGNGHSLHLRAYLRGRLCGSACGICSHSADGSCLAAAGTAAE